MLSEEGGLGTISTSPTLRRGRSSVGARPTRGVVDLGVDVLAIAFAGVRALTTVFAALVARLASFVAPDRRATFFGCLATFFGAGRGAAFLPTAEPRRGAAFLGAGLDFLEAGLARPLAAPFREAERALTDLAGVAAFRALFEGAARRRGLVLAMNESFAAYLDRKS